MNQKDLSAMLREDVKIHELEAIAASAAAAATGAAPRVIHFASKINDDGGQASALCFRKPRPINLRRATWTIRTDAVTCDGCLELLKNPFIAKRWAKWRTP